mgnify:CR=1 FL=1
MVSTEWGTLEHRCGCQCPVSRVAAMGIGSWCPLVRQRAKEKLALPRLIRLTKSVFNSRGTKNLSLALKGEADVKLP